MSKIRKIRRQILRNVGLLISKPKFVVPTVKPKNIEFNVRLYSLPEEIQENFKKYKLKAKEEAIVKAAKKRERKAKQRGCLTSRKY